MLGWQNYLGELIAWAMEASLELGNKIEHASKKPEPVPQSRVVLQVMHVLQHSLMRSLKEFQALSQIRLGE